MQVKKQQLEPDMGQRTDSKSGKEYVMQFSIMISMSHYNFLDTLASVKTQTEFNVDSINNFI